VSKRIGVIFLLLTMSGLAEAGAGETGQWRPWDPLINDSWIGPYTTTYMYAVNTDQRYEIRFNDAPTSNVAKGMNALRFSAAADGESIGNFFSTKKKNTFFVRNFGGHQDYSDILLLIAIDANALPDEFRLSLDVPKSNEEQVRLSAADFVFYDHPDYDTYRPSGYYSDTDPTREALGYAFATNDFTYVFDSNSPRRSFESGMVCIVAFSGLPLVTGGSAVEFNYLFEHLSATAVFSVYSYKDGLIEHTNRALLDNNDATSGVSSFEVVRIAGDFDGDSHVNASDLATFAKFWLTSDCQDGNLCKLADFDDNGVVNMSDLAVLGQLWQTFF